VTLSDKLASNGRSSLLLTFKWSKDRFNVQTTTSQCSRDNSQELSKDAIAEIFTAGISHTIIKTRCLKGLVPEMSLELVAGMFNHSLNRTYLISAVSKFVDYKAAKIS